MQPIPTARTGIKNHNLGGGGACTDLSVFVLNPARRRPWVAQAAFFAEPRLDLDLGNGTVPQGCTIFQTGTT